MKDITEKIPNLLKYPNIRAASSSLRDVVVEKIINILKIKNQVAISLPGGSTPKIFFNMLSQARGLKELWDRIHIFLGDERFVPHNSDLLNSKLIYNNLIEPITGVKPIFHPININFDNVYQAANQYSNDIYSFFGIKKLTNTIPEFDIMILGIGTDGHIASIFPNIINNIPGLNIIAGIDAPTHITPKVPRITMTLPLIKNSTFKFFLFSGKNKLELFNVKDRILPFQYVENPYFFYCD